MAPKAKSSAPADISMVAPHSLDSPIYRAPHIQLTATREGLRAFLIKFQAILTPDLSNTLDTYLENPRAPKSEEAKAAHKAIWRALVPCLNGLQTASTTYFFEFIEIAVNMMDLKLSTGSSRSSTTTRP